MATAAASRLSGPVLSVPSYRFPSPTRVKLSATARSPSKSVSVSSPKASSSAPVRSRQSCLCSPTNHPGSFRCSRHKERKHEAPSGHVHGHRKQASPPAPSSSPVSIGACSLGAKRMGSAMESGTWARRALAPSPQSPHRRRAAVGSFHPRPSRLSAVSIAGAGDNRQ